MYLARSTKRTCLVASSLKTTVRGILIVLSQTEEHGHCSLEFGVGRWFVPITSLGVALEIRRFFKKPVWHRQPWRSRQTCGFVLFLFDVYHVSNFVIRNENENSDLTRITRSRTVRALSHCNRRVWCCADRAFSFLYCVWCCSFSYPAVGWIQWKTW